jgi:hypothetical protein
MRQGGMQHHSGDTVEKEMAPTRAAQPDFPRVLHAVKRDRSGCSGRIVPRVRGSYVCLVCEICGGTVGAIDTPVFQALYPGWLAVMPPAGA